MQKSKRIQTAKNSLQELEQGFYLNKNQQKVSLEKQQEALANIRLYTPDALDQLLAQDLPEPRKEDTVFEVNALTTLDSVRAEYLNDPTVLALNFASARNPGGGVLKGANAQEESIARASGLYPCLLETEEYYRFHRNRKTCLYSHHMIYSPGVPVFKLENGEPMDEPVYSAILTSPAVNAGVVRRNELNNRKKIEPVMLERMDRVLAVALHQGHRTLILGAWGCGVFQNIPVVVAQQFHDLLHGKYRNQFKRVVFSVYARDDKFISPFEELFSV